MKTIMVFGTFDIIHGGHLHLFREAKKYGDKLVVVVARDSNVEKIKGIGPLHSEQERLELLRHLDLVDEVILGHKLNPYKCILDIRPDVIALGYDQKIYVDKLADAITTAGLKCQIVRLTPYQQIRLKSNKIRKYIERLV